MRDPLRFLGPALGAAVLLLALVAAIGGQPRARPVASFDPAAPAWHEQTFRERAYFGSRPPLPASIAMRGSYIDGDAWRGEFRSGWFAPRREVTVLVAGYPGLKGNALAVEWRDTRGVITTQAFAQPNPGEAWLPWRIELPAGAAAFRFHAVDGTSEMQGWLALSAPFTTTPSFAVMAPATRFLLAGGIQAALLLALGWSLARWVRLAQWPWLDERLSALVAAAGVAVLGYAAFWLYFAHPLAGRIFSWTLVGASGVTLLRHRVRPNGNVLKLVLLALTIGGFYVALLTLEEPARYSVAAQHRFINGLPPDNEIPRMFAERLWHGESPRHLLGDWLSSDRPPLQSGWVLLTWPVTDRLALDSDTAAGLGGVCFQLLWVFAVSALARYCGATARQAMAVVAAVAFTGICLVFSVYVWPKFGAAALMVGAFLLWFGPGHGAGFGRTRMAAGGVCAALGWLAHGGVAFSLLGLAALALARGRRIPLRSWWPAALCFLLLALPWTAYQRFYEPPADRLLKWHLAGVPDVDARGFGETIRAAYQKLGWAGALHARWVNLRMQVVSEWSNLARALEPKGRFDARFSEFFYFARGLGLWALAAVVPLLAWRRAPAPNPGARLALAWLALGMLAWLALMFLSFSASIHQGTLVTQLLAFTLLAGAALRLHRAAFLVIAFAQAAWFLVLWSPTTRPVEIAPLALAVLSGGALLATVWQGSRTTTDPRPTAPRPTATVLTILTRRVDVPAGRPRS